MFGLVSITAQDGETEIELGAFGTTGTEEPGIYEGTCETLAPTPAFALNPFDPDTLNSVTTVATPYTALTDGTHAVAIRARDGNGTILACNEIPTP